MNDIEHPNSRKISEQLQEWQKPIFFSIKDYNKLIDLIQQVKELENDRISLQQQVSEYQNELEKMDNLLYKTIHEKNELKLKSDTDNSRNLEEFKKEIRSLPGMWYDDCKMINELADKYFGDKK